MPSPASPKAKAVPGSLPPYQLNRKSATPCRGISVVTFTCPPSVIPEPRVRRRKWSHRLSQVRRDRHRSSVWAALASPAPAPAPVPSRPPRNPELSPRPIPCAGNLSHPSRPSPSPAKPRTYHICTSKWTTFLTCRNHHVVIRFRADTNPPEGLESQGNRNNTTNRNDRQTTGKNVNARQTRIPLLPGADRQVQRGLYRCQSGKR